MSDKLEQAQIELRNINEMADIKSNPVVESFLMPVIKSVPVIGDMIDSSMDYTEMKDKFLKKKAEIISLV